eukprot:scaffold214846_cov35-Tisochrysis_lutea.AAC.1
MYTLERHPTFCASNEPSGRPARVSARTRGGGPSPPMRTSRSPRGDKRGTYWPQKTSGVAATATTEGHAAGRHGAEDAVKQERVNAAMDVQGPPRVHQPIADSLLCRPSRAGLRPNSPSRPSACAATARCAPPKPCDSLGVSRRRSYRCGYWRAARRQRSMSRGGG